MIGHVRTPVAILLVTSLYSGLLRATEDQAGPGEQSFRSACAACHTIGEGRLVGPDLIGVTERRDEKWLIDFVQHSQQLVSAGDPTAVALFQEFGEIPMPDQSLSAGEIRGILAYIRSAGSGSAGPAVAVAEATPEQINLGQALFQGTARFANSGPTCIACHEVRSDSIMGGGALARELTAVYSRVGGAGVQAILQSPPFPVMQRAYQDNPLTEDEIVALVGFLRRADEQQALHQPRGYTARLLGAGIGGAAMLLLLYSLLWSGRLRGSVNQSLYDRQIKST